MLGQDYSDGTGYFYGPVLISAGTITRSGLYIDGNGFDSSDNILHLYNTSGGGAQGTVLYLQQNSGDFGYFLKMDGWINDLDVDYLGYFNSTGDFQIRIDRDNNSSNSFRINNGTNQTVFEVDENGNASSTRFCLNNPCISSWSSVGGVSGSGLSNYVAKWTHNGSVLGNSIIYDNGSRVGINTNNPQGLLDVDGAKLIVKNNGNVGIGTTTPSAKLHIEGGKIKVISGGNDVMYLQNANAIPLTFRDEDNKGFRFWEPNNGTYFQVGGGLDNYKGMSVGNASYVIDGSLNQNLIYGNVDETSDGNLLLLQKEDNDKFRIDSNGNISTAGTIIQGASHLEFRSNNSNIDPMKFTTDQELKVPNKIVTGKLETGFISHTEVGPSTITLWGDQNCTPCPAHAAAPKDKLWQRLAKYILGREAAAVADCALDCNPQDAPSCNTLGSGWSEIDNSGLVTFNKTECGTGSNNCGTNQNTYGPYISWR